MKMRSRPFIDCLCALAAAHDQQYRTSTGKAGEAKASFTGASGDFGAEGIAGERQLQVASCRVAFLQLATCNFYWESQTHVRRHFRNESVCSSHHRIRFMENDRDFHAMRGNAHGNSDVAAFAENHGRIDGT